jgi:hypothetical protein
MSTPEAQPISDQVNRLQRWFQAVITHADGIDSGAGSEEAQQLIQLGPGQLEKVITRSRALTAAERLAIYATAYHTRLLECLGEVFSMLKCTLGDEAFDSFAFGYLQEHPPRSYTLNELGRHFPRYLEDTRSAADGTEPDLSIAGSSDQAVGAWPDFVIDLAQLEWAIYEVFDGPGVEGQSSLGFDQILNLRPEQWAVAQLDPVPCLQLLATRFPVNDYYTGLRQLKENESVHIPRAHQSFVAFLRRDFVVRRYNLSETQFELLRAIQSGLPIGQAIECGARASSDSVDQLASNLKLWFRNWTAEGFFRGIKLPGDNTTTANNNEHEH